MGLLLHTRDSVCITRRLVCSDNVRVTSNGTSASGLHRTRRTVRERRKTTCRSDGNADFMHFFDADGRDAVS